MGQRKRDDVVLPTEQEHRLQIIMDTHALPLRYAL